MKGLPYVLLFTAMTFLAWGAYGPVLHHGTLVMSDSLRAFVGVGIAYFVIAVMFPIYLLRTTGENGKWSMSGVLFSLFAGSVGAIGALGVILALAYGGLPLYVMPLVFGFAPIVNTLVTAWLSKTFDQISALFIAGIITAALGAAGVIIFKPATVAKSGGHNKVSKMIDLHTEFSSADLELDDTLDLMKTLTPPSLGSSQFISPVQELLFGVLQTNVSPKPNPALPPEVVQPEPLRMEEKPPAPAPVVAPAAPVVAPAAPVELPPIVIQPEPLKMEDKAPSTTNDSDKASTEKEVVSPAKNVSPLEIVQEGDRPPKPDGEPSKTSSNQSAQAPKTSDVTESVTDKTKSTEPAKTSNNIVDSAAATANPKPDVKSQEIHGEAEYMGAKNILAKKPVQPLMIVVSIIVAALCWGSYGPLLHQGQARMAGSRLRPFTCVGIAYFFIAVAAPLAMISSRSIDSGSWSAVGMGWSIAAGSAGAIGALGVILAFNAGGKPYYVMPLVFGFAPVINTFISLTESKTWAQVRPEFWISLLVVIAGAVTVLITAPKPKHAPAK